MPGEEDVVQRRDTCQDEGDDEAEDHEPRHLGAVLLLRDTGDGLVRRHDALGTERSLDHDAERVQGRGDERHARTDEKEPKGRLQTPADHGPDTLAQRDKTDGGDEADEERRDAEDLIDEKTCDCVDDVHVLTLLWVWVVKKRSGA